MISPLVKLRRQPEENYGWLPTARLRVSMPEPYHARPTLKDSLCSGFSIRFLFISISIYILLSYHVWKFLSPSRPYKSCSPLWWSIGRAYHNPQFTTVLKILRVKLQEWLPVGRMEQAPDKKSSHQCQSSLQKCQKRLRKYER